MELSDLAKEPDAAVAEFVNAAARPLFNYRMSRGMLAPAARGERAYVAGRPMTDKQRKALELRRWHAERELIAAARALVEADDRRREELRRADKDWPGGGASTRVP